MKLFALAAVFLISPEFVEAELLNFPESLLFKMRKVDQQQRVLANLAEGVAQSCGEVTQQAERTNARFNPMMCGFLKGVYAQAENDINRLLVEARRYHGVLREHMNGAHSILFEVWVLNKQDKLVELAKSCAVTVDVARKL